MYFVASLRSRLLFLCLSASHAGCCCYRGSQHHGGGPRYTICSHPLQLRKNTLSQLITCSWRLSIQFLLLTHQEACFIRYFVKKKKKFFCFADVFRVLREKCKHVYNALQGYVCVNGDFFFSFCGWGRCPSTSVF